MATLTVRTTARDGTVSMTTLGVAAGAGGDKFLNTGVETLLVNNGDSGSHTVTLVYQTTVDGAALTAKTVAVAAGDTVEIGPFPTTLYNDGSGFMNVTYSAVTSVKVLPRKTGSSVY